MKAKQDLSTFFSACYLLIYNCFREKVKRKKLQQLNKYTGDKMIKKSKKLNNKSQEAITPLGKEDCDQMAVYERLWSGQQCQFLMTLVITTRVFTLK